jgi:tetratricopeptide (TPR) repeat protein
MWRSVLRLYDDVDDEAGRAHARWLLALVLFDTDESPAAAPLAEQALEGFRRVGDDWGMAAALNVLGWTALARSDLAEAKRMSEQSLALFRRLGDRWGQVRADDLLGVLAEAAGDLDRATSLHRDGLHLAEEIGLWPAVADHLGRLGRLATLRGRLRRRRHAQPPRSAARTGPGLRWPSKPDVSSTSAMPSTPGLHSPPT